MRLTASSAANQTYHNAGGSPTFRDSDSTGTSKPPLCMCVQSNSSRCAAIRKWVSLAVESTKRDSCTGLLIHLQCGGRRYRRAPTTGSLCQEANRKCDLRSDRCRAISSHCRGLTECQSIQYLAVSRPASLRFLRVCAKSEVDVRGGYPTCFLAVTVHRQLLPFAIADPCRQPVCFPVAAAAFTVPCYITLDWLAVPTGVTSTRHFSKASPA